MAATAQSFNDPKAVQAGMKQLDRSIADLTASLAAIKKAKDQVNKTPDQCKGPFSELGGQVADLAKIAKEMDGVIKSTAKSIVK